MVYHNLARTAGSCIAICLFATCLFGQQVAEQAGEKVYAQVSESVFLIQVTDAAAQPVATATGFIVAPDLVLTNAHVARAGTMTVHVGSLDVPCPIERVDAVNDLALCRMQAKSGAAPLKLATQEPKSGATVYAVGNPRGLERTISQGLFTGYRDLDGHQVAQISAAISPGSSGGPVLNAMGELVGVAVSSLVNGQNLNFAVSLSAVRSFLKNESTTPGAAALLDAAKRLVSDETTILYSDAPDSMWKKTEAQIRDLLFGAIDGTSDRRLLVDVYDTAAAFRNDIQVRAARKLLAVVKPPDREIYKRLSLALYISTDEEGPSPQLDEAEKVATRAVELGRNAVPEDLLLLGNIQRQAKRWVQAYATFQRASAIVKSGTAEASQAYYALFQTAVELGRTAEAESWFGRAKREGIAPYQIATFADYLEKQSRYADAAASYLEAFEAAPRVYSYVCSAGKEYWVADKFDEALAAERRCIELATSKQGAETTIAFAHSVIADVLNGRNVYEEAASHAKEAIQINASNAWPHYYLAVALQGQRRFSEAGVSVKNALRLSDGKFSEMHFALGSALVELRQYAEARHAFQKAAELAPKDPASAYNVALCFYNENFFNDALTWYREVLRRDPNYTRDHVLKMIDMLSKR